MNPAVFIILLMNFALIAALPFIFFRKRGPLTTYWWLTACPLFVSPASLIACQAGILSSFYGQAGGESLQILALITSTLSMMLITFTLGSHRIAVSYFHQEDDAPEEIVIWGAYRHIRHPFYASFLLALLSVFLCCPQAFSLLGLISGFTLLDFTADREERRLCQSKFGPSYRHYMNRTGRFLPRGWPS